MVAGKAIHAIALCAGVITSSGYAAYGTVRYSAQTDERRPYDERTIMVVAKQATHHHQQHNNEAHQLHQLHQLQ
jgi:hypothetical protein